MANNAQALLKAVQDEMQELKYREKILSAYLNGETVVAVNPVTGEKTKMTDADNFNFSEYVYGITYDAIPIEDGMEEHLIAIDKVDWDNLPSVVYPASSNYYTKEPVDVDEYRKGIYPAWVTYLYVPETDA